MRLLILFLFLIKFSSFGEYILNSNYFDFLGDRIFDFECLLNNIDAKLVLILFLFELYVFILEFFPSSKSKPIKNSLKLKPTTEPLVPIKERTVIKNRLSHRLREQVRGRFSPQYVKEISDEESLPEKKIIKTPFLGLYYPASSSILSVCIRFMGAAVLGLTVFYIIIYNDILNTPELNIFFFDVFFLLGMGLLCSHIISSISHVLPVEDMPKESFINIIQRYVERVHLYVKTSFFSNYIFISRFFYFIDQSLVYSKKGISFLCQFYIFKFISEISFTNKLFFLSLFLFLL